MNSNLAFLVVFFFLISCKNEKDSTNGPLQLQNKVEQYITILGIAQDGGFPHINNTPEFLAVQNHVLDTELVVSLGLVDQEEEKKFIFEATPDMPKQLAILEDQHLKSKTIVDGVFLTHAHIGHYTGLMYFGREAMGSKDISVYAMPRMESFLKNNGPWSQLISLDNIKIRLLQADSTISVTQKLSITPFLVPHRDEFSETVGYKISGTRASALFIPDINKWSLWERNIIEEVKKVDYAFIDATFFREGEIPRPMAEVPHPFISETIELFKSQPLEIRSKIVFIHFNHSNPVLRKDHKDRISLEKQGYKFANSGDIYPL